MRLQYKNCMMNLDGQFSTKFLCSSNPTDKANLQLFENSWLNRVFYEDTVLFLGTLELNFVRVKCGIFFKSNSLFQDLIIHPNIQYTFMSKFQYSTYFYMFNLNFQYSTSTYTSVAKISINSYITYSYKYAANCTVSKLSQCSASIFFIKLYHHILQYQLYTHNTL